MFPVFCLCEVGLHRCHLACSSIGKKTQSSHQDTLPTVNPQPQGNREQMLVRCDTVLFLAHTNHFKHKQLCPSKIGPAIPVLSLSVIMSKLHKTFLPITSAKSLCQDDLRLFLAHESSLPSAVIF